MSKKSQKEAAEKKREKEEQERLRFLGALQHHLDRFAELLPRGGEMAPLTELGLSGYEVALRHLSPGRLQRACDEALKVCTFFPKPKEILDALTEWEDRQPIPGTATYYEIPKDNEADRRIWLQLAGKKWGKPWHDGLRWNREDDIEDEAKYGKGRRENGWRPRDESIKREIECEALGGKRPHFHVVDKRIAPMREPGEEG